MSVRAEAELHSEEPSGPVLGRVLPGVRRQKEAWYLTPDACAEGGGFRGTHTGPESELMEELDRLRAGDGTGP